jgi:hypothetical protein
MACKSYGDPPESPGELKAALLQAFEAHTAGGGTSVTVRRLLEGKTLGDKFSARQGEFIFSADDVLEEAIKSREDLEAKCERVAAKFFAAREGALSNTRYYLSMVSDLDVYVATSMRTRDDFRNMANACEKIFRTTDFQNYNFGILTQH